MTLIDTQDSITAQARSIAPLFGGVAISVIEGSVPSAALVLRTDGMLTPYVIARYGNLGAVVSDRSFGGARYDGYQSIVDFYVVANDEKLARQMGVKMFSGMLGFVPAGAGELSIAPGGGSYTLIDAQEKPVAYVYQVSFRFLAYTTTPV